MNSFFWLYLTINAPDFRLILQDRNTHQSTVADKVYTDKITGHLGASFCQYSCFAQFE